MCKVASGKTADRKKTSQSRMNPDHMHPTFPTNSVKTNTPTNQVSTVNSGWGNVKKPGTCLLRLCLLWAELTIRRVFRRARSWIEARSAAGHRILLSRRHKLGPVLHTKEPEATWACYKGRASTLENGDFTKDVSFSQKEYKVKTIRMLVTSITLININEST